MPVSNLLIGLGNPGDDYARTRHNVGFMAIDEVANSFRCAGWKKKFKGLFTLADASVLLKPQTYMNLSGESASEAMQFYQLQAEQIVVLHDDLDLPGGEVRVKQGGGSGGHNGLKSLDSHVGQNYWRVRIGIGRPLTEQGDAVRGDAVTNYVLNAFSKADKIWLEPLLGSLANHAELLSPSKVSGLVSKLTKA